MVIRAEQLPPATPNVPALIIGGGGCGLTAALALRHAGVDALVLERDASPLGTTSMSTGLIPGCGSALQRARGIADSAEIFAADILAKTKGQVDADFVLALAKASGRTIDWLVDDLGVNLSLVDGFLYPGHSRLRMHGMPHRSGAELMGALTALAAEHDVTIMTEALVDELIANADDKIIGVNLRRPGDAVETIGCDYVVLACCGFAGNHEMVRTYIPELEHATFFGHPGNKGDAIRWGRDLGAAVGDLTGYQGHAGLAFGHNIPILWPLIAEGGIQVNSLGLRFADESRGYSDQSVDVLAQPGHVAWSVFDDFRHDTMMQFADYQAALSAGCILDAPDIETLAERTGLPLSGLAQSIAEVNDLAKSGEVDRFGRSFAGKVPLSAPYRAVKVTGALFHTQGGLLVNEVGQVKRANGDLFPNLFAGGGAARGISGPGGWGYLAGNGLVTATTLGRLAGEQIARALASS
jgi:fumarate reductase flavoprotein subunit